MTPERKKALLTGLKLLISLAILWVLLTQINSPQIWQTLQKLNLGLLLGLTVLYLMGQWLSAYRWGVLAKSMGLLASAWELFQYYIMGMFLNCFLPSSIGGDIGRATALSQKNKQPWVQGLLSTVAERLTGLVSMLAMMAAVWFFSPSQTQNSSIFALLLGLFVFSSVVTFGFRWLEKQDWSRPWVNKIFLKSATLQPQQTQSPSLWPKTKALLSALGLSIIFHGLCTGILCLILWQLGATVHPGIVLLAYGLGSIVSLIPVSLNGIGPREGTMVAILGHWGQVPTDIATATSLAWLSIMLLASLPGGLLLLKKTTP